MTAVAFSEAWVELRCSDCGDVYTLYARRAFEYRREGREPRCRTCRRPERPPPDEGDRRYWLERFSLAEIRELAAGIWGHDDAISTPTHRGFDPQNGGGSGCPNSGQPQCSSGLAADRRRSSGRAEELGKPVLYQLSYVCALRILEGAWGVLERARPIVSAGDPS